MSSSTLAESLWEADSPEEVRSSMMALISHIESNPENVHDLLQSLLTYFNQVK
jgi:hypothetical protein